MNFWRSALLVLLLSAASPLPASAAEGATHGGEVSMDQAVKMVERQYHARVVKAEVQHGEGRTTYVLKLLNEAGKVWTVHVDAASGAVQ